MACQERIVYSYGRYTGQNGHVRSTAECNAAACLFAGYPLRFSCVARDSTIEAHGIFQRNERTMSVHKMEECRI